MSEAATRSPREIIDKLKDELTRVREERDRVEADRARLERERDRLWRENERLAVGRRASRGLPASGPILERGPTIHPRRLGQKAGAAYGRQGRRAVPPVIDGRNV